MANLDECIEAWALSLQDQGYYKVTIDALLNVQQHTSHSWLRLVSHSSKSKRERER